jgi:amidohydrolase
MSGCYSQAKEIFSYTRDLRREFHRNPELGFQEFTTAKIIQRELANLEGMVIRSGIATTGIQAVLESGSPGKTILLRFDMDALPVDENTGVDYASTRKGLMHACGHDGHMAIGLTVARLLHADRENLAGRIVFIFQPAEEGLGGALKMIEAGILQDPKPDIALGLHLWNDKPLGWMGISDGPVMSASETFQVQVRGKGGHGAKPQEAIDPVVASAAIINSLQSLISREVHPLDSGVITVSTIRGGEVHNVIPDLVTLTGTIRSFRQETKDLLLTRFQDVVTHTVAAYSCSAEVTLVEISPAVINDPEIAEIIRKAAAEEFPEGIIDRDYRTMASEDMAFFMQQVPGCYIFVGSANPMRGLTARHHQPEFNFDEEALTRGSALLLAAVPKLLSAQ